MLLVDDDEMAVELVQIRPIDINRLHCNVVVGQEGLARLHGTDVDLVLLDINMPRMDGIELLQQMRAEKLLDSVRSSCVRPQPTRRIFQGPRTWAPADTRRRRPISSG